MSRRKFSNEFKARIALEAAKEIKTLNELASEYKIHQAQISKWKNQLLSNLSAIFGMNKIQPYPQQLIDDLYRQIGEVTVERDWLKKKLQK